jgi:hypothetical protein
MIAGETLPAWREEDANPMNIWYHEVHAKRKSADQSISPREAGQRKGQKGHLGYSRLPQQQGGMAGKTDRPNGCTQAVPI